MHDLGKKIATGAGWMIAMRLADRALGLVSTLILARLLVPQDFGLVALATSFLAALEVLGTFSFDFALIQNQSADKRHYDTAWTITVIYGAVTAVALAVSAPLAAKFFDEPRLVAVMLVLALSPLVEGFSNIGVVAFRKELNFRREFALMFLKRIVAFTVTVAFAFALRTYWALVIGTISARFAGVLISYFLHPFRPSFSLTAYRDLFRFSSWMVLNNVVVFAAVRGYDFIIARLAGTHGLGVYSVAYEISNLPTTELVYPLSRAVFPGFSRMAVDRSKLQQAFLAVASLAALATIPMGAGISVLAEPLVRLLLGDRWLESIPLVRTLALYGILRAAQAGTGDAYLALGAPRVVALINFSHLVIGWPLMLALLPRSGLEGAVWAVLLASSFAVGLNFTLVVRILGVRLSDLARCFWRPAAAGSVMYAAVWATMQVWAPSGRVDLLVVQTAVYVGVGVATYAGALLILWIVSGRPEGGERMFLRWCSSQLAARATKRS